MRSISHLLLAGLAAAAIAVPAIGERRSDDEILPKSVELMQQGRAMLSAGKFEDAQTIFEAALAVDPRNRWAYVESARVAERQKLYGKAIRLTNKALSMEPNDLDALAVQGEAMVQLGAIARAQANLQKIKSICAKGCPQLAQLSNAIGRGPRVAAATVPPSPKKD